MVLKGIRVVEIGQFFAGPFASAILANLGADVIKVERPETGDEARRWGPPFWGDDAAVFHAINGNKKSVALDLKCPQGQSDFKTLVSGADVLLHNMRPGTLDRFGFGPEELCKMFPELIYGEISAFGHVGPLKMMPGYEILSQAFGGVMSITGEADRNPVRCGPSVCDFGSGMWLVIGILAALHQRAQTGKGCVVQNSLYETALTWTAVSASSYFASGKEPMRMGAGHYLVSPYGYFETRTRPLILACGSDGLFRRLATVLGHTEWLEDARFKDNPSRVKHKALIEGMIADILIAEPQQHWFDVLNAAGVPSSPVNTVPQALDHEQARALGIVQADPANPDIRSVGLPVSFDGIRPELLSGAPKLGASDINAWKER